MGSTQARLLFSPCSAIFGTFVLMFLVHSSGGFDGQVGGTSWGRFPHSVSSGSVSAVRGEENKNALFCVFSLCVFFDLSKIFAFFVFLLRFFCCFFPRPFFLFLFCFLKNFRQS